MFKKLRNKLILINMGVTSVVVVVVFVSIYNIYTYSANRRPPIEENSFVGFSEEINRFVEITIKNEKQNAARDLLIILISSGVVIEIVVFLLSYYMAEQSIKPIKEAYESQKVFIANASHEMKTPLAAISANLEAADIHGNKWISNVEKETEKLTNLNNQLLTLARTDLMTNDSGKESELRTAAMRTVESFEPRLKDKDFKLKIDIPENSKIKADDYSQILGILLDNAIKYSDKKIRLAIDAHTLSITNDGAKIAPNDLEHVFDRFYQADKSAEGVGLGLSIAKSLADRNGWELTASSEKNTTFKLNY